MPSTIPYDPSLTLGNVIRPGKMEKVKEIARIQAAPDSAEKNLNSLISLKRSLDMTLQEMIDMGVNTSDLNEEIKKVKKSISVAAKDYADKKIAAEKDIQKIRSQMSVISDEVESPIDYDRSQIKDMALSHDSLQLNVQYFSVDRNEQKASSHVTNVSSFVNDSFKFFGNFHSRKAAAAAQAQLHSQMSTHSITGSLVISISCTHKNAKILSPLILDADKTVNAWNTIYPNDIIDINAPELDLLGEILSGKLLRKTDAVHVLTGATYGSSFVGMIHILKTDKTISHEHMESVVTSLQQNLNVGGWFSANTGNFGVEGSFTESVKNLLSIQNIQSHCNLVTMGIIPSIKSNEINLAVQTFADFDPAKQMEKLSILQGATASEKNTIASAADAAKVGQQMISLQNATIKATLTGLAAIEDGKNKILDINSLMTAMDDYIVKCIAAENNIGVPVNYYIKPITKLMAIRALLDKYYPDLEKQKKEDEQKKPDDQPTPTPTPVNPSDDDDDDDDDDD